MNEFSDWLTKELQDRQWGTPDLARAAHVSRGAIGNVLRGDRKPGPDLCKAISHALRLPPEEVFRQAGLLPPIPGEDAEVTELEHIARQLDETNKNDLVRYARLRLQIQEEKGEYHVRRARPSDETSKS